MKKGFTLIELLGVIIILALLVILVFPSIINSVKRSGEKTDEVTLQMIYNASDIYISNHAKKFKKTNGNKFVIPLTDLVSEDLVATPIKLSNSDTDITTFKSVQATYSNGKFEYELKDNEDCVTVVYCDFTDNDYNNSYSLGDAVDCSGEGFYIISSDTDTVTLIARKNLNLSYNPGQSGSARNVKFALGAYWWENGDYKSAYDSTDNPPGYPTIRYVYDENATIDTFLNEYKRYLKDFLGYDTDVRPLNIEDAVNICGANILNGSCPNSSLPVIFGDGGQNYWTGAAYKDGSNTASIYVNYQSGLDYAAPDTNNQIGVRPVVIIDKDYIPITN